MLTANADDYDNRLATLTAAKDLPDILYAGYDKLAEYVENGIVMPLDDLLAQYGQNVIADKDGDFSRWTFDGQIYGISNVSGENVQANMIAMRKDWLDKLNLKVPETLDEFYDAPYAFTYNDLDGDGVDDTYGLCMNMGSANTYGEIPTIFGMSADGYTISEGKVMTNIMHPNYLEYIKFMNKLYEGGVIDPDFATKPWVNAHGDLMNGMFGCIIFVPMGTTNNWASRYVEKDIEWVYVDIKGPDGMFHGYDQPDKTGAAIAINANCKNPEAAMKLIDFMATAEGSNLAMLGLEGTHYEIDEATGSAVYLEPYCTLLPPSTKMH